MTDTFLDDQQLPAAVQDLDDAVYQLTKTQITSVQGRVFTAPSLWVQMQQAVHGTQNGAGGKTVFRSSSPAWLEGIDWCRRVDTKVREWLPHHDGHTLTVMTALPEQKWPPHMTTDVSKMAKTINAWTRQAEALLSGEGEMEVKNACPECGERYIYRPGPESDKGEPTTIRTPALVVNSRGARCRWCSTEWGPELLEWLARLVGAEPVDESSQAG